MSEPFSPSFIRTVEDMCRDMRFVGIFGIILGALNCLSIIGAIVGIPYIIASLRVREAADAFSHYASAGDAATLERAFEKQKSAFFITKVLLVLGLIIFAVSMFFFFSLMGAGIMNSMETY